MFLKSFFHKNKLKISPKAFAGGGEGNLFHILQPEKSKGRYIVKLYHPHKLGPERQKKLHFLYDHPPVELTENKHPSVVWVVDLLYNAHDQLVGFVMPFVKGEKLEILCTSKLPKNISPVWLRFGFPNIESRKLRMRLCFNIAVAIYEVHSTQNYVLVDLKPDNVIVQPNGLIALVDTDSVEVVSGGTTLFEAPVATPEYTPAEFYIQDSLGYDPTARQEWDLFALGVIFYKLLFGIHPFAAGNKAPYDNCLTLEQKIEAGLYVHAPSKQQFMAVIPPPHQAIASIPMELQDLFMQCFVEGHKNPERRPTAEEWCMALLRAIDDPSLHQHFDHLFAAQYFDTKKALMRKSVQEIYGDFGINDVLKKNLKPSFVDFEIPSISKHKGIAIKKTSTFGVNSRPKGHVAFYFFLALGVFISILGFQEPNPFTLISFGFCLIIFGALLWPISNYFSFINSEELQEKTLTESRLATTIKLFQAQQNKLIKWSPLLKNINFDNIQNEWNKFLEEAKQNYKEQLIIIDSKIRSFQEMENLAYEQIYQNFVLTVHQQPLLKNLEGDTAGVLRDSLNAQKDDSDDWRAKREAFNDLVFKYRHHYITEKNQFDLNYQQLVDQAKALREVYKDKILYEQIKVQNTLESVNFRKIPMDLLEPIPKYLTNMKMEIEELQQRKEELKDINYGNYLNQKK